MDITKIENANLVQTAFALLTEASVKSSQGESVSDLVDQIDVAKTEILRRLNLTPSN